MSSPPEAADRWVGAGTAALVATPILLWGTAYVATDVGARHSSDLVFSAVRTAPAGLLLLAVAALAGSRLPRGRELWWAFSSGLLIVVVFVATLTAGVSLAGAGNAAVLTNTAPFFVLVFARIVLGERVSPLAAAGVAVGFAGVVLMVWPQLGVGDGRGDLALGVALSLVSAAGWAAGTLVVKWLLERRPGLEMIGFAAAQYLTGAVVLAVLGLGLEGAGATEWSSGELWASVAWLAAGVSAVAMIAFYAALRRLSATRITATLFLVPAVAVLVELARGNVPESVVLAGMALAVVGVAAVNRGGVA